MSKNLTNNKIKIYSIDYLKNEELTEDDIYYVFDTSSLIYSIIVGMFRYAGINDKSNSDIINMVTKDSSWCDKFYWTKKKHDSFTKLISEIFKNVYQIKDSLSLSKAQMFVLKYGFMWK